MLASAVFCVSSSALLGAPASVASPPLPGVGPSAAADCRGGLPRGIAAAVLLQFRLAFSSSSAAADCCGGAHQLAVPVQYRYLAVSPAPRKAPFPRRSVCVSTQLGPCLGLSRFWEHLWSRRAEPPVSSSRCGANPQAYPGLRPLARASCADSAQPSRTRASFRPIAVDVTIGKFAMLRCCGVGRAFTLHVARDVHCPPEAAAVVERRHGAGS